MCIDELCALSFELCVLCLAKGFFDTSDAVLASLTVAPVLYIFSYIFETKNKERYKYRALRTC